MPKEKSSIGKRGGYLNPAILLTLCFGLSGFPDRSHAEFLGRLFTTPAERVALDKLRFAQPKKEKVVVVKKEVQKAPPAPPRRVEAFRMDGLVVRSEGPNTAWVGGNRVLNRSRIAQGVTVDPGSADRSGISVTLPMGGKALKLRPGQAFEPEAGRVTDGLGGKAVGGMR